MQTVSKRNKTQPNDKKNRLKPKSQWQLMFLQFKRHKLAMFGLAVLILFYIIALAPQFFAPFSPTYRFTKDDSINLPPQRIRFFDSEGTFHLRPFVYEQKIRLNLKTYMREIVLDKSKIKSLYFFVHGSKYKLWNFLNTDLHLFGLEDGSLIHIFGTNSLGQDIFSRTIYAMQVSLSIGFVGVIISTILGIILGGISGYYGGTPDLIIQRFIEILMGIPRIPLWMSLAAAIPRSWSVLKIYFLITVILSMISWTGLARNIRSKLISLKDEDFVWAAKSVGSSDLRIILTHLIPNFFSYIIVSLTLAIPGMIIAETSLSFLGIGLKPPIVSWGVLLQEAQSFQNIVKFPWLMIPGIFVVIAVLCFNFVGDGLRDAADPYSLN